MSIGIFYGSDSGATEEVAENIAKLLNEAGLKTDLYNIADTNMDKLAQYSNLIIGTSTWGDGELQGDWEDKFPEFEKVDFSDKTVAFFGLGDQDGYGDSFANGMGILYDAAVKNGAKVIGGGWPTDGYDFEDSLSVKDGKFIGLAIDEENQGDLTYERIEKWVDLIKTSLK